MSRFNRAVFGLKNGLFRGRAVCLFHELQAAERLAPEQLEELNWQRRRDLALFAFEHAPFYRRAYKDAGLDAENLAKPETFARLPIVTRDDLRNHFDDFVADTAAPADCSRATTGGSTGTPITVLHDRRAPVDAVAWRTLRWWQIDPSDDAAFVYRLRRRFPQNVLNALLWWPTKRISLDASLITEGSMREFVERYESLRPALLQGYIGAVHELALFLRDNAIRITPPKAVWVTSAPLTEAQRSVMQTAFGAPVYDQYGTCEVMWLAAECRERAGLHMIHDLRHIEFVDDAGQPVDDDEWGRILVTDLLNRAFPLIRYEIGDMGRRLDRACPCGVTLPLMDKVRGRISDVIRLPSGRSISGEYLTTIFDDHPEAVAAFQIHQRADLSIVLRCVRGRDPQVDAIIQQALADLTDRAGQGAVVALEIVDRIAHDRGKTRFILSDVDKR